MEFNFTSFFVERTPDFEIILKSFQQFKELNPSHIWVSLLNLSQKDNDFFFKCLAHFKLH